MAGYLVNRSSPHIVIDGLYGIQSYGDDAMLLALINNLRLRIPGARFTVLSRHPSTLINLYGINAIHNLDHPEWVKERGYWFYGFNDGQPRDHIDKIRDTIANADLLIIGGGNLLLDITDDWLRGPIAWHWFSSEIARIYSVPYMLFASSIGPFCTEWGKARSAHIVRNATYITVREKDSLALVEEMIGNLNNVALLPDPALALQPDMTGGMQILLEAGYEHKKANLNVGISVRDLSWSLDVAGVARYITSFQSICNMLIEYYDAQLIFIPQCSYDMGLPEEDDRNIARFVVDGVNRKDKCILLNGQYRADEIMGVYKSIDIAIATRLHASVFSAIARTPFMAVGYLPKVQGFLQHVGVQENVVTIDELANIDHIMNRIHSLLGNRKELINGLDAGVGEAERKAQEHFNIIESLINLSKET